MTPDPSVELNDKLVELNVTMSTSRLDGARGVITADTENSSQVAAQAKSTCEGGHEMATNHVGIFTEPNPYNPAGNLRAGGYELLGGHRQ